MEKFRKEILLPKEIKQDLKRQALDEGYNSMKEMIEKKTIKSFKEYKEENKKA